MSIKTRDALKQIYVTGAKPTETNFHDWLDSFRLVSENIPMSNITGLSAALNNGIIIVNNYIDLQLQNGSGPQLVLVVNGGFFIFEQTGTPDGINSFSAAGGGIWMRNDTISQAFTSHLTDYTNSHKVTFAQTLNEGNQAIAGTSAKAPILLKAGSLLITPQDGALEKDTNSTYITDKEGLRIDLLSPHRSNHKIFGWQDASTGQTFTLPLPLGGDTNTWSDTGDGTAVLSCAFDFWKTTISKVIVEYYIQDTLVSRITGQNITAPDNFGETFVTFNINLQKRLAYPCWFYNGANLVFDGNAKTITETNRFSGLIYQGGNPSQAANPTLTVKVINGDNTSSTGTAVGRMEATTLCVNKTIKGTWQ